MNPAPDSSQPLVLVVDDHSVMLKTLAFLLGKLNYRVQQAVNGEEALTMVETEAPDVVLTDANMPVMDGWTLIRRLRVMKEFAFTPIIVLSGSDKAQDRQRAFEVGADDFVNKQYLQCELKFRIDKSLTASRLHKRCALLEMMRMNVTDVSFTGRIEDFQLPSLVTICRMENSSGILELTNETNRERGLVYIRDGGIVAAKLIGHTLMKNEDAVTAMMMWTEGTFSLDKMDTSGIPNEIAETTDSLLLTAATRLDEQFLST